VKHILQNPFIKIINSFLIIILIGTLLLFLPFSSKNGLNFLESFFLATSSTCVTGLTPIQNLGDELTIFGKIVMMMLIEIGGMSIITLTAFVAIKLNMRMGISDSVLYKEALNQDTMKNLERLIQKIIMVSLTIQGIGIIIGSFIMLKYYPNYFKALSMATFHTVSSFNNAGFDIFGENSLIDFRADILFNIWTMVLIIIGGLGFVVIIDIVETRNIKKLSINSKITLIMTTSLIILGSLLVKLTMGNNITILQSIFTSVTCRTAGFQTFDMATLTNGAFLVCSFLMFVGCGSGSTGGGIKVSSLFIILNYIFSFIRGKSPRAFMRRISQNALSKVFSLLTFTILYIFIMVLIISIIEPDIEFRKVVFECISAFSTTGLSMGITSSLKPISQVLICSMMFIGRIGPLTLLSLLNNHVTKLENEKIKYIEENIMIG
jgi:trk system potassium uptake protein TrkH